MSRFSFDKLPLEGLYSVNRQRMGDERGFLARLFCAQELEQVGWCSAIAQINHTYTAQRGTVRGMHYQNPPYAEMKLVSCIRGEVWDVAVDLRHGSPTFLAWHAEHLSAENGRALLIPQGFAHGFQTLSHDAELLYCHSSPYVQQAEAGIHPTDPRLGIAWPLNISTLSQRDSNHLMLTASFKGI